MDLLESRANNNKNDELLQVRCETNYVKNEAQRKRD